MKEDETQVPPPTSQSENNKEKSIAVQWVHLPPISAPPHPNFGFPPKTLQIIMAED